MGSAGPAGAAGAATLVVTSPELPGTNCTTGGVKLEAGVDANGNGSLDALEVNAALTRFVCNGIAGGPGATGAPGPAGAQGAAGPSTVTKTTNEAAGANCATGGVKLEFGADADGNGTLDTAEINASLTRYVCNGAQGVAGATGPAGSTGPQGAAGPVGPMGPVGSNAVAATAAEAAGANCATGGVRLQFGVDANGNGALDSGEVNAALTRYVCNGAQGPQGVQGAAGRNAAVATAAEAAGGNCATGGTRFQAGVDANGNGVLDAAEVNAALTRYVCNGAQGPQGVQGSPGPVGATGPQGPAGVGGYTVLDANNVVLGRVLSVTRTSIAFITSAGYLVTANWDGSMAVGQFYFSGAGCTGSYVLNGSGTITGRTLVYSAILGTFQVPTVGINANATSTAFTSQTIENPTCMPSAGPVNGWAMQAIAPASAGLPRLPPFAAPLKLQ